MQFRPVIQFSTHHLVTFRTVQASSFQYRAGLVSSSVQLATCRTFRFITSQFSSIPLISGWWFSSVQFTSLLFIQFSSLHHSSAEYSSSRYILYSSFQYCSRYISYNSVQFITSQFSSVSSPLYISYNLVQFITSQFSPVSSSRYISYSSVHYVTVQYCAFQVSSSVQYSSSSFISVNYSTVRLKVSWESTGPWLCCYAFVVSQENMAAVLRAFRAEYYLKIL